MSQLQSKTLNLRQTLYQTSYNPQSESKFQFNDTMKSFKRKSTTQRYKQFSNQMTLDFSDLQTHKKHKRVNSTTQKQQFHPLPQIKIPKNKKGPKKGSFLQTWLNEALDNGGGNSQNVIDKNEQTLASVKNYELDKTFLRTQNVSQQVINKIYKSLFVYTHGINVVFEQISKLAEAKSPNQKGNTKIIEIFWRAFSKLLQNQTSYKTTFQLIEKKLIQDSEIMKIKVKNVAEEYQKQLKQKQSQIQRLQREIQKQNKNFGQLQIDLKVNAATLQLTDEAFNDEVQLRLKFQQKINAVYTSYEQMKQKYERIVKDIRVKEQFNMEKQYQQKKLKLQIQDLNIKCEELMHFLKIQKAKTQDRDTDIVILKQQLKSKQQLLLQIQHNESEIQEFRQKSLNRYKLLQVKLQQNVYELSTSKTIIKQQKDRIMAQQARITQLMQVNNELFQKKLITYNRNSELEQQNLQKNKKAALVQAENQLLKQKLNKTEQKLKVQIQLKQNLIEIKNKQTQQISQKISLINMKSQIIEQLKAVKDKYQMGNSMLHLDKKQLQKTIENLMTKICNQQQKNLISQKLIAENNQIHQISERKHAKDKQIYKKRITELNEVITKKEDNIMYYANLMESERNNVKQRELQIKKLNLKLQQKDKQILNIKNEKLELFSKLPQLQKQMINNQEKIKNQMLKCEQIRLHKESLQKQIQSASFLLKTKKQQKSVQNQGLKQLLQYFKKNYLQRKNYIHPMILQDFMGQCFKIQTKLDKQIQNHQKTKESISAIQNNLQQKIDKINKQKLKLSQRSHKLNNQVLQLKQDNQNLKNRIAKYEKSNDEFKHRIDQFRNMLQKSKEEKKQQQQKLIRYKQQSKEQIKKLQINNEQIRLELNKKILSLIEERKQLNQNLDQIKTESFIKNTVNFVQKQEDTIKIQPIHIKQIFSIDIQTQQSQQPLKKNMQSITFQDVSTQTVQIYQKIERKQSIFESKQIKKDLVSIQEQQQKQYQEAEKWKHQYAKQIKQQKLQEQRKNKQIQKNQSKIKQEKQSVSQKKVQNKDFKRALKLTFMRR